MWSTLVPLSVFAGLLAILVVLWGVFLHSGARYAQIPDVTVRKTVWITALVWLCQPFVTFGIEILTPDHPWATVLSGLAELGLTTFIACVLIAFIYETSFLRAFQAWLPSLLAPAGMLLLVVLVVRPWLYDAYQGSNNAMAPTLLGWHREVPCPRCGAPAFGSPWHGQDLESQQDDLLICSRELRTCVVAASVPHFRPPDHFLVNRLRPPQRWDIIVFRFPQDPATLYVQRIVGLPGEALALRGGAVWIDGQVCEPPEALRGLEYVTAPTGLDAEVWGTEGKPVKLGRDEYFVLGDFSSQSKDSRVWGQGVPDRPPYAVPADYIEGVVTHLYWPPSRWRVFP